MIEVLYVRDCPHYQGTLALVERVRAELGIDTELRTTLILDEAAADQARFPGSPTVRVDGRDVEPDSEPATEYVVGCRLYRLEHRFAGQPEERWIRQALLRADGPRLSGHRPCCEPRLMPARHRTILQRELRPARCLRIGSEADDRRPGHDAAHVRHMDAYDRADFERLAEIYAEDARWRDADPNGPHCRNRDDIFTMFRQRMDAGIRIGFDEMRSTPTEVLLTARVNGSGPVVTVFSFQGRRIVAVTDYPSMEAAEAAIAGPSRATG